MAQELFGELASIAELIRAMHAGENADGTCVDAAGRTSERCQTLRNPRYRFDVITSAQSLQERVEQAEAETGGDL
jgi:hypothetical protein